MLFHQLEIYKDIFDMSKILHKHINKMPRYYKYDSGDEIRKLLRQIRYSVYLINSHSDKDKFELICHLLDKLVLLKIIIDELIEDKIFLFDGKGNIINIIILLTKITKQATKWKNYMKKYKA